MHEALSTFIGDLFEKEAPCGDLKVRNLGGRVAAQGEAKRPFEREFLTGFFPDRLSMFSFFSVKTGFLIPIISKK